MNGGRGTPTRATPTPTEGEEVDPSDRSKPQGLVRTGALAGLVAAVGTMAVAAVARAADVSLEVDGQPIPIPAFALWTLVGAGLGIGLARLLRERRRFVAVAVTATALSLIPAITAPDDAATSAVLVGAHLLAASIIIAALSRQLPTALRER